MNDPVKPDTAVLESLFDPLKISPGANSTGPAEPGVVPAAQEPLVNVNLPAVVVVGSTGSGKSQFLNFLAQKNLFTPIPDADRKVDDETYLKHAQLDCTCLEKKHKSSFVHHFYCFSQLSRFCWSTRRASPTLVTAIQSTSVTWFAKSRHCSTCAFLLLCSTQRRRDSIETCKKFSRYIKTHWARNFGTTSFSCFHATKWMKGLMHKIVFCFFL